MAEDTADKKLIVYHRPNWPPALNNIYGDIVGQVGYITDVGTVHLLGPGDENPDIPKTTASSNINGPTLLLSASSSGFS